MTDNSDRAYWSGCNYGEHAEMACIKKFRNLNKVKKKKYNMVVIRLTANLELKQSKPCSNCLKHIIQSDIPIKYIFFSEQGKVVKYKLNDLLNSEKYFTRRFKKK